MLPMMTTRPAVWLLLMLGCGGSEPPAAEGDHPASLLIGVLDQDDDGHLSLDEYVRATADASGFEVADQDGDGLLSGAELGVVLWRENPSMGRIHQAHAGPQVDLRWGAWLQHAERSGVAW
jgi:hypothetical protein